MDVKQHFNNNISSVVELRSCVKVEVAVPNKSTISVDVKQHLNNVCHNQRGEQATLRHDAKNMTDT